MNSGGANGNAVMCANKYLCVMAEAFGSTALAMGNRVAPAFTCQKYLHFVSTYSLHFKEQV